MGGLVSATANGVDASCNEWLAHLEKFCAGVASVPLIHKHGAGITPTVSSLRDELRNSGTRPSHDEQRRQQSWIHWTITTVSRLDASVSHVRWRRHDTSRTAHTVEACGSGWGRHGMGRGFGNSTARQATRAWDENFHCDLYAVSGRPQFTRRDGGEEVSAVFIR